jgi:flagellar hook-associated protein 1
MASDLLSIAASGARAARAALDVTAQNIANASSDGYVRRSVQLQEVSAAGGPGRVGDLSLSGARVAGISRNADMFRQAEVRRTGSDLERSMTELRGLENIEAAVEQSGVFNSIVEFEASLQQLAADPTDPSLRAATLSTADTLARKFNIAVDTLDAAASGLRFDARAAVSEANVIGGELARVNLRLARAGVGSSDRASLLDQRDALLEKMSGIVDITTSFAADGTVTVDTGGANIVNGGNFTTMSLVSNPDGTIALGVGATAVVSPAGGKIAGAALALAAGADVRARLDALADTISSTVNAAQAQGVALDGSPGQPLFSGTGAAAIRIATSDSAAIATAPAGSPAASLDGSNLAALRAAMSDAAVVSSANGLLFDVSSAVSGRRLTLEALDSIASSARIALEQQAGVDLDTEAANLMRFQQAFQASGRAMQVASRIFDTLMEL